MATKGKKCDGKFNSSLAPALTLTLCFTDTQRYEDSVLLNIPF